MSDAGGPDGAEERALRDLEKAEADLKRAEGEVEQAAEELEAARHKHDGLVLIFVDGAEHKVRPGTWIVHELKTAVDVVPAKVLAEITPQGLKDLDDNAEIEVHENEKFMTHARSGGSS